jgi:hypothetical protein
MKAFICTKRPRSVNAKGTSSFQQFVVEAFRGFHQEAVCATQPLYGIVYYLPARPTELDADNLSKPIWDALQGICYDDDKRVRHRRAGIIDLQTTELQAFDLSAVPDDVAAALIRAVGTEDHVLYIEYGSLSDRMFVFALERAGL